jgi:antitoxin VapB
LEARNLDALLLQRVSSFAWATCGVASYVNTASTNGESALLITPQGRYLITNNIEAERLKRDPRIQDQGWEFCIAPWYKGNTAVADLPQHYKLGADSLYLDAVDLSPDIARLRANLTPEEGERFRALGKLCADAMLHTSRVVQPGQSGHQIAALLARETERQGAQATVILVAVDDEIFTFRHPLPSANKLNRYAMLILCGRRDGLVCSITRLIHFGRLPDDLRRKAEAVAYVDAAMIDATRPSARLREVFQSGMEAYASVGYPDEWILHHQGGPAGYEPREYFGLPDSTDTVQAGQVYAWNPSITGTKSEDTILITETGSTVLTAIEDWPLAEVEIQGCAYQRPAILEVI